MKKFIPAISAILLFSFLALFLFVSISKGSAGNSKCKNLVLSNFTLIDGTGTNPVKNKLIYIKGDRIEKIVDDDNSIPGEYEKVDLKGGFVLPGFINTHVHCYYSEKKLQNWLKGGVTTVMELAARPGFDFSRARDQLDKNSMNARILSATPIFTVTGGYCPHISDYMDTPEEAAQKTQEYLKKDPDIIKISIEDNLMGTWKMLSLKEIQSITSTAHKADKKVAAHISHVRNLRLAIDGGVDVLAHMVVEPLDKKQAKEIVDKGIYWIPTLELWTRVSDQYRITWDKTAIQNLSIFYKAGGKIALGTDYNGFAAKFENGMPITELKAMKKAGMSNMDIITAATRNAAFVCGKEKQIGTIEDGKIADLIVAKNNPLKNLNALSKLSMVMHNGDIVFNK